MSDPALTPRWFYPTPGRFVIGLLVAECLLWLSERFRWFSFNTHKGWTVLIVVAFVGLALLLMLLWFAAALVFRWRFQFSIRSLLVLTVAVAIPCSWYAAKMKQAREQTELVKEIVALHGSVMYDWDIDDDREFGMLVYYKPSWAQTILPNDLFQTVVIVGLTSSTVSDAELDKVVKGFPQLRELRVWRTTITDAGLEHLGGLNRLRDLDLAETRITDTALKRLKGLNQLQTLRLDHTNITDAGLANLKGLNQLQELLLRQTQITDAGLTHLAGLNQLRILELRSTQVTDAGLKHLQGLSSLQELSLNATKVTDAGLEHLIGLKQLRILRIWFTKITDEGVMQFQQRLPTCTIDRPGPQLPRRRTNAK